MPGRVHDAGTLVRMGERRGVTVCGVALQYPRVHGTRSRQRMCSVQATPTRVAMMLGRSHSLAQCAHVLERGGSCWGSCHGCTTVVRCWRLVQESRCIRSDTTAAQGPLPSCSPTPSMHRCVVCTGTAFKAAVEVQRAAESRCRYDDYRQYQLRVCSDSSACWARSGQAHRGTAEVH